MAVAALRPEERPALALAVVLHLALVALLLVQPRSRENFPIPERMSVSLADDVALEATGPVLSQDAQVAVAPTIAEEIAPPAPPAEPAKPAPPVAKPLVKPAPAPAVSTRPQTKPQAKPQASPAPPKPVARPVTKPGGGSRLGSNFLDGAESGSVDANAPVPASQIGASEKASLAQAIARQLKPRWSSPQGVDAELLVTVLSFNLNPDGTLAGKPQVVSQSGITDGNRPQAGRHAELAVRAVELAAPFDLPAKYYNAWKRVSAFRFDRKLSQ